MLLLQIESGLHLLLLVIFLIFFLFFFTSWSATKVSRRVNLQAHLVANGPLLIIVMEVFSLLFPF
jgi:hypothetical protein